MAIIRDEFRGEVLGVPGRFRAVATWEDDRGNAKRGGIANQRFVSEKRKWIENGDRMSMNVEIRFDDRCQNGHASFGITANGWRNGKEAFGGCCHDEIERRFPEFSPLIKWHLCSTDGPLHYVKNTIYLAGDRDHWGKRAGEPRNFEPVVRFGDNPITHMLDPAFAEFLKEDRSGYDFEVTAVHGNPMESGFRLTRYTVGGYATRIAHKAPFRTEREALEFVEALQRCDPQFGEVPTAWGEGKARQLDAARSAAIWPEATDAQLMAEPDILRAALEARLPGLLAEFEAAMRGCGFIYPDQTGEG